MKVRAAAGGSTEWLDLLASDRRAAELPNGFWGAAERLPMLRAVYGDSVPLLPVPGLDRKESWGSAPMLCESLCVAESK